MNILDAYIIMDDYINAVAKGNKGKFGRKIGELKNTKQEIRAAGLLLLTHAVFWNIFSKEKIEQYKSVLRVLPLFNENEIIEECEEIQKQLENRNFFTKIRNKVTRNALKEKLDHLTEKMLKENSKEMRECLDDFTLLDDLFEMANKTRKSILELNDEEYKKQYSNIIGNFVCDVYEKIGLNREYNDTEYFWPFSIIYQLAEKEDLDYLFEKYYEYLRRKKYEDGLDTQIQRVVNG